MGKNNSDYEFGKHRKREGELLDILVNKFTPYMAEYLGDMPIDLRPLSEYMPMPSVSELESEMERVTNNDNVPEQEKSWLRKELTNFLEFFTSPPDEKRLRGVILRTNTGLFASAWAETLRHEAKTAEKAQLEDYLLPQEIGRSKSAWNHTLGQLGIPPEDAQGILRKFGQNEITDKLELPSGNYVQKTGNGYELLRKKF